MAATGTRVGAPLPRSDWPVRRHVPCTAMAAVAAGGRRLRRRGAAARRVLGAGEPPAFLVGRPPSSGGAAGCAAGLGAAAAGPPVRVPPPPPRPAAAGARGGLAVPLNPRRGSRPLVGIISGLYRRRFSRTHRRWAAWGQSPGTDCPTGKEIAHLRSIPSWPFAPRSKFRTKARGAFLKR